MKKVTIFIMLLMHMNYFMFLPQVEEVDSYDPNGRQTEDINSVVEYVRVVFGFDTTADDEDDDSQNNFSLLKTFDYFYQQQVTILEQPGFKEINNQVYGGHTETVPLSVSYDIISPPPEV